tara:strand:+ start:8971 stop:10110 length:1140 start_codon:yes stop_codon:yes gene_type:complete
MINLPVSKNLIFQSLAVGIRSILIFLFVYFATQKIDNTSLSILLSQFTYASIFSHFICFGFDYSFIQEGEKKTDLKSFYFKIVLGSVFTLLIIKLQGLDYKIFLYSIAIASSSIFKGLVRLNQTHMLDFIVNFSTLCIFLFSVKVLNINDFLDYLALSIFIPNLLALFNQLKFSLEETFHKAYRSVLKSLPLSIYAITSYLWLNVDVYVFDYLDKIDNYSNFTVPNRFFINLTMIPVILMNYRIAKIFINNYDLNKVFKEFNLIGILLFLVAFFISGPLITFITNDTVSLSNFHKLLFSSIVYMRTINTFFSMLILKNFNNWIRFFTIFITLILHIIILYFSIVKYDWIGALYALVATTLVFVTINFVLTKKYLYVKQN